MLAATLGVLALSVSDLSNALDSPSGVTFTNATGTMSKVSKYSNDHIGNWDTGKKETVYPSNGAYFLKMNGGSKSSSESRSSRIVSSFTFTVPGAGTLTFQHRVATYCNDDVLVFYEDDINNPLLELGGEYWRKKEPYDGDVYFDLEAENFWVEDSVDMTVDRYSHTIKVALLAPYNGESYWDKEDEEIVENCAWLDDFVWEPDNDMVICGFDTPGNVTEFDGKGLEVSIYSNYESDGELVFEYWYTIDGSTPVRNGARSQKYGDDERIMLPGTLPAGSVTVRVAVYDGNSKIGEYSRNYMRKLTVDTPKVTAATQSLFDPGITLTLDCEAAETPVYYYTTDGSEPTTASSQATGNTILVTSPCTVKIIASAMQDLSPETLTVNVTQATQPTYAVQTDGEVTAEGVRFAEQCVVTAFTTDGNGVHFRMNDDEPEVYEGSLTMTESTMLYFATAGTVDNTAGVYQLNSAPVSLTVTRLSVGTPTVADASQGLFEPGIALTLDCERYGATPVYHYTTNGKEPTASSPAISGDTILIASPCMLKVIAIAEDTQSPEALTIDITQAGKPTYTVKADGGNSGNLVFQTKCVVTAQAPGGAKVHYRENGGAAAVYSSARNVAETTTLEFATAGVVDRAKAVFQLNSAPVAVTVTKETANDGMWATEQVEHFAPNEWSIFAVTRRLSDKRSAELIAWLHPFAYNASKRALERATTLQGGASYLVHSSMIIAKKRPASFADGGEAAPLTGDGSSWLLSSEGAEMIWDGKAWLVVPSAESHNHPGWRR